GLARSLAEEHPEFRCVRMDLDPAGGVQDAGLLLNEIRRGTEDEVAFRGRTRFVQRLARHEDKPAAQGPYRLSIAARGVLDNLKVEPAARREPAPGQVEIAVEAAGLVFRDVLNALDMYPGDPGPLGGECAGKIAAIGAGVTGLREGDEVVTMAPGCHDGFVLSDARLVARKAASLSFEEAITLPISFLTAGYALEHLAQIRRGDRILIHSGAGGVGLAAIQIAQRAGAEIFATAGSDAKRGYLKSLGVPHVLNSRSLSFAEEIRERTGGRGVDIVLNSLAGEFVAASFAVTAVNGRFIEIGKRGIWTAEQARQLGKNISYHVLDLGEVAKAQPEKIGRLLAETMEAAERGQWKPLPFEVFPFCDAIQAYRHMAQAQHTGKIVLRQEFREVRISPEATYLIAGGFGGLGLELGRWLVE